MTVASGLLLAACAAQVDEEKVVASSQQLRAARAADGALMLGVSVLVTGNGKQALACEDGELTVEVAYSLSGETDSYETLPQSALTVRCSERSAGDFALVVDNSGSAEGVLSEVRHAARDIIGRLLPLGGRASLVRVSTEASILSEVTDNRPALEHAVNDLHVNDGWTALYDGLRVESRPPIVGAVRYRPS